MSTIETLERHLVNDLRTLGDRIADEKTARDLYRALTSRALRQRDEEGHLALSYKRAEDLLREAGVPGADGIAGSGGEGELTDRAREVLESVGWTSEPENVSRNDPMHDSSPRDAPPASRPEGAETPEWERTAHEEAERNRQEQR